MTAKPLTATQPALAVPGGAAGRVALYAVERLDTPAGCRAAWRLSTAGRSHVVELLGPRRWRCDCGDHRWRRRVCKHINALRWVLIALGVKRL